MLEISTLQAKLECLFSKFREKNIIVSIIILIVFSPFILNTLLVGFSNYNLNHGKYEKSEKLLKILLYIDKHIYGEKSNNYLKINEKLSDVYFNYGDYNKALSSLNDNYQLRKNTNNLNSFDGSYLLVRLTLLNHINGNYTYAEKFLKEAININTKLYGANSHSTISNKLALINLYLDENNLQKAEYEFNNSNFKDRKYLDNNQLYFDTYVVVVGKYYFKLGQKDKAESIYLDALNKISNHCPNYVIKYWILQELGKFYYYVGNYPKAEKTFDEMINLQINKFGKNSYKVADSYIKLVLVNLKLNRHNEALKLVEKALPIRESYYSPIHPKRYCTIYYKESILKLKNKDKPISLKYPTNSSINFINSYKGTQKIKNICNLVEMENY